MARDRQPILKKCRTLGLDPSILGVNKKSKRNIRPNANKKLTEYGTQLREKQKARFVYGVMEKQFYKLYEEATRKEGVTGELLLQYLERRLDNVIYRLGFGSTRRQARQIVSHGHILINGKRVDIASYRVKQGDVITLKEGSTELSIIKESVGQKSVPGWLSLEEGTLTAKVLENPTRDAVDFEINEAMIIEFYSR
ncbi:30S ribosomal protein S4 [Streptobacillus moniliformis]|uniref:Small ribosomal subunit protein uS4 n=1 Tax=Streptobacillus moniliformis (strain ATCC 14647 / DSM 12112 / NCTC 10651 / 9901) TaxID=519441 RepID=D1AWZ8_STRM9|nr:30S ribosomal protein S4 [Streptobacillus moniliformis]ACZ00824.1 ribosomal protein S4 [Streptobacillus moniliformis DSM 12112]AVL42780.1 30S ribosomal protein S4 [Streptobacillus moniliformis]QXW65575.1 30S ribosomal protein S4 [Streptobacillus moniliformis]SQA14041.1 30S ribosomal protein S4 [Streptobacillus moniliformis]